jgi:hypothetical protein
MAAAPFRGEIGREPVEVRRAWRRGRAALARVGSLGRFLGRTSWSGSVAHINVTQDGSVLLRRARLQCCKRDLDIAVLSQPSCPKMKTGRQLRQSQPPGQGEENETNTNIEVDTREAAAFKAARLRFRNHRVFRGETRLIRHVVAGVETLQRAGKPRLRRRRAGSRARFPRRGSG